MGVPESERESTTTTKRKEEKNRQGREKREEGAREPGTSCNLVRSGDFLFTLEDVRVCPNSLRLSLCCHGHKIVPIEDPRKDRKQAKQVATLKEALQ